MPNPFKAFCPNCEKETKRRTIETIVDIKVRGENIPVHDKYYQCEECGEDYEIPSEDYDPLAELYQKLGLKTREDRKAFIEIHHIAFNISQMRHWLNNRISSLNC